MNIDNKEVTNLIKTIEHKNSLTFNNRVTYNSFLSLNFLDRNQNTINILVDHNLKFMELDINDKILLRWI